MSAAGAEALTIPGPAGSLGGEAIIADEATASVVIIPGSGPTDHDGNSPAGIRSDSYKLLAEGFAAAGVSTLRIDKRGFFSSREATRDPNDVSIADYASDTARWAETFAKRTGTRCVWLAGHSEGGLVALVAASHSEHVCGLILLAAPGRPISDLMREQFRRNPANASILPELEGILSALEKGAPLDPEIISPALRPLFSASLQRYMIQLFRYDPAALARNVALPTLVVQGDRDVQVTPQDARLLADALPADELVMVPGMTHMLKQDVPGDPLATYRDPQLPLDASLVSAITGFVERTPAP